MSFKTLGLGIAIMVALTVLITGKELYDTASSPKGFYISPDDRELVALGRVLYVSHCAACHGAKLEGQPNWRERRPNGRLPAPPHDASGHTWHHPDAVLFDITRNGFVPGRTAPEGYETDMPAYAGILSDEEIVAVIAYIKSTWPPDVRTLHDEVNHNAWQRQIKVHAATP